MKGSCFISQSTISHGCSEILGVTIVTPIRNDPGRVRSPHANVWGRLVSNHLPTGKKAGIRSQIDLPN